jgi:hypothetical protein
MSCSRSVPVLARTTDENSGAMGVCLVTFN